jgi:Arc/MetJ-type ribon-helix-helix transcriptional regulator
MAQVQLTLPEKMIVEIDSWIAQGKFKSRSNAIKPLSHSYDEREKTREFYQMLNKRGEEAKKHPEKLVPLEDV